ncbi:hypothetical protein FB45DRAFT_1070314 [Roridomyces roridus]|uniref:Uncharacterized protein n=1 Tax=Roridomyces roridus TaxID=1738132 RepID=A0AAD7AYL9_9AGAR|nr:hypothetical protein FB45DRAFT_1070314 [Roridomyces roridus]
MGPIFSVLVVDGIAFFCTWGPIVVFIGRRKRQVQLKSVVPVWVRQSTWQCALAIGILAIDIVQFILERLMSCSAAAQDYFQGLGQRQAEGGAGAGGGPSLLKHDSEPSLVNFF